MQPVNKGVTVQSLQIKNFLGIKEMEFTPDGKFNFITGRNGAGKTSVLRAIQFAFEGKERGTENVDYIHNGEDKAEILIDLGKFQIKRGITAKSLSVDVTKDGFKAESPSTLLKEMVGRFSFNPIDFAFCAEKERNEVVLGALGVEYTPVDAYSDGVYPSEKLEQEAEDEINVHRGLALIDFLQDRHYRERTEIGRGLDSAKKTLAELKEQLPENYLPFNKEEYEKLLEAIENQKEIILVASKDIALIVANLETAKTYIQGLSGILTKYGDGEVHCKIELIEQRGKEAEKELMEAEGVLDGLKMKEKMQREAMEFAKLQGQIEDLETRIPNGQTKYNDLEIKIKKLRGEIKQRLIASADIGIEGLAFEGGRFTVKGVPVENLSDSEKLRVGVKIAEKTVGKLDFIFIDGVERLDPETLKDFVAALGKSTFQYFFTTCHAVPAVGKNLKIQ